MVCKHTGEYIIYEYTLDESFLRISWVVIAARPLENILQQWEPNIVFKDKGIHGFWVNRGFWLPGTMVRTWHRWNFKTHATKGVGVAPHNDWRAQYLQQYQTTGFEKCCHQFGSAPKTTGLWEMLLSSTIVSYPRYTILSVCNVER